MGIADRACSAKARTSPSGISTSVRADGVGPRRARIIAASALARWRASRRTSGRSAPWGESITDSTVSRGRIGLPVARTTGSVVTR